LLFLPARRRRAGVETNNINIARGLCGIVLLVASILLDNNIRELAIKDELYEIAKAFQTSIVRAGGLQESVLRTAF
jgi:hypothetical protein